MSLKVDILQSGTNSHGVTVDDFNAFATDFLVDGIVGAVASTAGVSPQTGGFAINQQAVADMTVAVSTGTGYVTGTPTSGVSQRLRVVLDATASVTIASNSTGATRYDWIYIKLDADKMKDPAVDATDVATLVVSRSTSSTTDNGTPPTYGYNLAVVTVANGASSITNANIADKRSEIVPTNGLSAWKTWTPTFANFTKGSATIVAKYTQVGKTIHFKLSVTLAGDSSMGTNPTFTFPVTASSDYVAGQPIGTIQFWDLAPAGYLGLVRWASTTVASTTAYNAAGTYLSTTGVTATVPFTWATGDYFSCTGTYEAATV